MLRLTTLIITSYFLFGCSTFGRLGSKCQSFDEEAQGADYAKNGTSPANFDALADQCAKHGYRTPSKDKFLASYRSYKIMSCSNSERYFRSAYRLYSLGGAVELCSSSDQASDFKSDQVRNDAFSAYQLKKAIKELDTQIQNERRSHWQNRHDDEFLMGLLLRSVNETDPEKLITKRNEKAEELKILTKKYNLFISDLE